MHYYHLVAYLAMKYRSRTDIVAQILDAAEGGATKTKVMYKAFLSYAQLREYIAILVKGKLIAYDNKEMIYKTTERGHRFLKLYNQIEDVIHAASDRQEINRLPH